MLSIPSYIEPDFQNEPFHSSFDAVTAMAQNGTLPDNFYTTTPFPSYIKVCGKWILLENSRMDGCIVIKDGVPTVVDPAEVVDGDMVVVGRSDDGENGLYVHSKAFRIENNSEDDNESFRRGFSRETSQTRDYDQLYDVLRYDRENGNIVWVLGSACAYDYDSRRAMANIIKAGYCDALISGNALALFDLEAARFNTCSGQDIYTKRLMKNGHYNQLDTINLVKNAGSIESFVNEENIRDGIMSAVIRDNIPYCLAGSTRDDGPLPNVITDSYESKKKMSEFLKNATTVVCLASQINTVSASRLTPTYKLVGSSVRPVYFFTVDISEFPINKVRDRGINGYNGIVTNIQDCLVNMERNLI